MVRDHVAQESPFPHLVIRRHSLLFYLGSSKNSIHKWDAHQVRIKNKYGSVRTFSIRMATFKKKLLTGFQMSKDVDSIEANFQIAFWKRTRKKYKKVASAPPPPIEENLETQEEKDINKGRIFRKVFAFRKFFFLVNSLVSLVDKLLREVLHIILKGVSVRQTLSKNNWKKSSQWVKVGSERQHVCSFCFKHVHNDLDYVHLVNSISSWICYFFSFNFFKMFY